jgi:hypothetical protein
MCFKKYRMRKIRFLMELSKRFEKTRKNCEIFYVSFKDGPLEEEPAIPWNSEPLFG